MFPLMDAAHDPGTDIGNARADAAETVRVPVLRARSGARILVGVASWTDPSMTAAGVFYPPGAKSAEARLRYYASRYPLVEVDSTYYYPPRQPVVQQWVQRTPPGFTFITVACWFERRRMAPSRRVMPRLASSM